MRPRLATIGLIAALLAGCGSDNPPPLQSAVESDGGPQHIHGLGINPSDGALLIATHTGLFRAAPGEQKATRIGDRHQDTMGFTVVGADRFLGSGHPDARDNLPPLLGLIRSQDAGRSWKPVSLLGQADFHVLRAAGSRVYGFDSSRGRLMVSTDGGQSWQERRPPAPLVDLAIDPRDPDHLVASSEKELFVSANAGKTWRSLKEDLAGLLAWTDEALVVIDASGTVHRSSDGGDGFASIAVIGGQPAALARHQSDLYVALHTNAVKVSSDGGRTWQERVSAQPE